MGECLDMFLCRFTLPPGARYRLFLDAKVDRDSAAVATATVTPIPSSVADLASRLKHLHPLSVIRHLNQCPDTPGDTRVQLAFADYLAACGSHQHCQNDQRTDNVSDVSMGA